MGLERAVGSAGRGVLALPAVASMPLPAVPAAVRPSDLALDSYQPMVVDEVVEIRLAVGAGGRLEIASGDVRRESRERAPAQLMPEPDPGTDTLAGPTAALGTRVDLVA